MLDKPLAFGHDARRMEEVSFTCQKIHWIYAYVGEDGLTYNETSGWDLVQTKQIDKNNRRERSRTLLSGGI